MSSFFTEFLKGLKASGGIEAGARNYAEGKARKKKESMDEERLRLEQERQQRLEDQANRQLDLQANAQRQRALTTALNANTATSPFGVKMTNWEGVRQTLGMFGYSEKEITDMLGARPQAPQEEPAVEEPVPTSEEGGSLFDDIMSLMGREEGVSEKDALIQRMRQEMDRGVPAQGVLNKFQQDIDRLAIPQPRLEQQLNMSIPQPTPQQEPMQGPLLPGIVPNFGPSNPVLPGQGPLQPIGIEESEEDADIQRFLDEFN